MNTDKQEGTDVLPTPYQQFIHLSRYSRWLNDQKRRETWPETVSRYVTFFKNRHSRVKGIPWTTLEKAILALDFMPSMRCLMTAGPALARDHVAGYNCAYLKIDRARAFDEIMFVLMCGTGIGFSVERQYITELPIVAEKFFDSSTTITVNDSKLGWAGAFREIISLLYAGQVPKWDLSKIRPAGTPLKTFGGRASGPGPLDALFKFTVETFRGALGRRLNSIEVFDIICKAAEAIVVGGVRRSALICLTNLSDDRMRNAKMGDWRQTHPHRAMANISVAYTEPPDVEAYLEEMNALIRSKSGERGVFNRSGVKKLIAGLERRDAAFDFGTNPCSEIMLRDRQFCNLAEVVAREGDTLRNLRRKVRLATITGTMQASLTTFRHLSRKWAENTKEEALLGVSITGIMDCPLLRGPNAPKVLENLRDHAVAVNKEWAKKLGINQATAITCVKPSGTVSQLVNSSSGIHGRHAEYYIRTVRADNLDPITKFMKEQGVPNEPLVGKEDTTTVFRFPMKAPKGSVFINEQTAIEQLEIWKMYAKHWCEHKPSCTIHVKENEWPEVIAWLWKNFDLATGISFLPYSGHGYVQEPYQPISAEEYTKLEKEMPELDWDHLANYENADYTTGVQELACSSNGCEVG